MSETLNNRKAFITGYNLAKTKHRDFSKAELETHFPRLTVGEIDAMSNGATDAMAGDSYRYKLAKEFLSNERP